MTLSEIRAAYEKGEIESDVLLTPEGGGDVKTVRETVPSISPQRPRETGAAWSATPSSYAALLSLSAISRALAYLLLIGGIVCSFAIGSQTQNPLIGLGGLVLTVFVCITQLAAAEFLSILPDIAIELRKTRQALEHMKQYYDK